MDRTLAKTLAIVLALFLVPACGAATDDDASNNGADDGEIRAQQQNENDTETNGDEQVVVVWSVSSGSPDYTYAWGGGSLDGDEVVITLPDEAPPEEALNSNGILGVGFVLVLPEGTLEPGEKMTSNEWSTVEAELIGMSDRHAFIYRGEGTENVDNWLQEFPIGEISCGQGVDAPEGQTFDTFEPVDCSELEVRFADQYEPVNWT